MVSNSQSLDLFYVTPKSLVWERVFLQIDTDMILKTKWERFHCNIQDQGFLSIFTCSHSSLENVCVVYVFIKEKPPYYAISVFMP